MLGRRRLSRFVVILALMVAAGCGSGPGEDGGSSPGESSAAATSGTDDPRTQLPTEDPGPSPREESNGSEAPVEGESGISIEIVGLPVGGGQTVDFGDAWCGILVWDGSLPTGVEVQITKVAVVGKTGAVVRAGPCEGTPPCDGTTISVDGPEQACAVVVKPPAQDTPSVKVQLDGTLHCPDRATCDSLNVTADRTADLDKPGGDEGESTGGTDGGEEGTDGTDGGGEGSDGTDGGGEGSDGSGGDPGTDGSGGDPGTDGSGGDPGTDGSGGDPGTDSSPTTDAPGGG